jgi:hypothetical protein
LETLHVAQGPQKHFSKFAARFVPLTLAWLKSVRISIPKGSSGPLKRFAGMRRTGLRRNEGELMEPQHARGFLVRLLNEKQRKILKDLEESMPMDRYLTGYEVCRMFKLTPPAVAEDQSQAMASLWDEFMKIKLLREREYFGKPRRERWQEWGEYVLANYLDPLPDPSQGGF